MMPQDGFEHKKGRLIFLVALVLGAAFSVGAFSGILPRAVKVAGSCGFSRSFRSFRLAPIFCTG